MLGLGFLAPFLICPQPCSAYEGNRDRGDQTDLTPKQPGLQLQSSSAPSPSPTAIPLLATPYKTKRDVTLPFYLFEIVFVFLKYNPSPPTTGM